MKQSIILLFSLLFCSGLAKADAAMDANFNKYKEAFVLELWKAYPSWASSVGYHKYDNALIVPDDNSRKSELAFCGKQLLALHKFQLNGLSDLNKIDYHLIENQLNSAIWAVNELKAYEWDPSGYNVSGGFADMLSNNYAPLDTRLRSFAARLAKVPAYYEAAKKNIKNPTQEHTQLAIEQNLGGVSVFEKDLETALKDSKLTAAEKAKITDDAKKCVAAINSYADFLKKLDNKTPRSFRLGKALYEKKFDFDIQSGLGAEGVYTAALEHKKLLHEHMLMLTKQLWPKYFEGRPIPQNPLVAIKQMIDSISVTHVKPEEFQSNIELQIPFLTEFIKRNNLIYIDPSKPLVVRREPEYMAGVAGASINAPGPYDKNGNTYYNVGSLDGWDADKAESYLREYNHYILQILNIHEAIPGHYTQLVYANQSPSIIKSILGNNAMIEGWAVYTERMMLENGYDADRGLDSKEASMEMWLMYDKWNLRSTCNTILDYMVHTRDMSKEDAMKLLVDEAFQQSAEAEGKWRRVSVTQVQLCCYFSGYSEIYALREECKAKQGAKFNLKKFHEQFLSYGSAPVKYIKEMMMK